MDRTTSRPTVYVDRVTDGKIKSGGKVQITPFISQNRKGKLERRRLDYLPPRASQGEKAPYPGRTPSTHNYCPEYCTEMS